MLQTWIVGLVAVTLAASSALAQPEDTTLDTAATPDAETEVSPATPARPAANEGATNAGPADDYRASEQISDDLSVSFPVDI